MFKYLAVLVTSVFVISCATQVVSQGSDQTPALQDPISQKKFNCVVNNNPNECRGWRDAQGSLDYAGIPFVLLKKLCPEIDPLSCLPLADHSDFQGDESSKLELFSSACLKNVDSACKRANEILAKREAEKMQREKQERIERERIAREERAEQKRKLAEEREEKRKQELEDRRLAKITTLENNCNEGNASGCLQLAGVFGKDDLDRAWEFFKKACEHGSMKTCQTIGKGALKRNDNDTAIFAYSTLCEKDISGSCDTLIQLRRMKAEEDDRKAQRELLQAQMALQMQQAEQARLERLEAAQAAARAESIRAMMQGFQTMQKAFQPAPIQPITPIYTPPKTTRCTSRLNSLGQVETNCNEGY